MTTLVVIVTSTALTLALVASTQAAGRPGSLPTPGSYRVDSEATMTQQIGPTTLTRVQRTDGATGQITVTSSSSTEPGNAHTQVVPGQGPDVRCVPVASPAPPAVAAAACKNLTHGFGAIQGQQSGHCNGIALDNRWTRIDDRTWDVVLQVTDAGPSNSASPEASIAFAAAQTPPAERAKFLAQARKEMPSDAQRAQAMNDLRSQLEAAARSIDSQEAAAARQALATMGGGSSGGSGRVTTSKERWTRIADSCSGKR